MKYSYSDKKRWLQLQQEVIESTPRDVDIELSFTDSNVFEARIKLPGVEDSLVVVGAIGTVSEAGLLVDRNGYIGVYSDPEKLLERIHQWIHEQS